MRLKKRMSVCSFSKKRQFALKKALFRYFKEGSILLISFHVISCNCYGLSK